MKVAYQKVCQDCKGVGQKVLSTQRRVLVSPCPTCHGKGVHLQTFDLPIKVIP